jgi:putative hydrolase of the HAD superfamily
MLINLTIPTGRMTKSIEAVVLDLGGVYCQGSFVDFMNRAHKVLGIENTFKACAEVVFDSEYNRGLITFEECMRKLLSVPINAEQMQAIKDIWTHTWAPTPEMLNLVQRLKQRYPLGMISNSDHVNSQVYRERGWYDTFNPLVLSHEVHILKPDRRIYEICLEQLGLPAESCAFIDDQEACLVTARELGMQTILYKSLHQLKEEFERLGIRY